jgi:putative endonuclease
VAWYVYMISNHAHTLYVGSTNDLIRRFHEHRTRRYPSSFTARYTFDRLVWFELVGTKPAARKRELQIKGWKRERKVALIVERNPAWRDLSVTWPEGLCLE